TLPLPASWPSSATAVHFSVAISKLTSPATGVWMTSASGATASTIWTQLETVELLPAASVATAAMHFGLEKDSATETVSSAPGLADGTGCTVRAVAEAKSLLPRAPQRAAETYLTV